VAIDPATLELCYAAGCPDARDLRITRPSIAHLPALPHRASLDWCWEQGSVRTRSEQAPGDRDHDRRDQA
jgi:hypothetical protein